MNDQERIKTFSERRRQIVRLAVGGGVIAIGLAFLTLGGHLPIPLGIALLLLFFVIAVIVNLKLWRCPECNTHLGKLYFGIQQPRFCPGCGKQLSRSD